MLITGNESEVQNRLNSKSATGKNDRKEFYVKNQNTGYKTKVVTSKRVKSSKRAGLMKKDQKELHTIIDTKKNELYTDSFFMAHGVLRTTATQ